MATDLDLFKEREIEGLSHREIAEKYGLNEDSVRSRISRVSREKPHIVLEMLGQYAVKNDRYIEEQDNIVQKSIKRYKHGERLMWVSDLHFPYANHRALELMYKLAEVFNPDCVTFMNDFWDMDGYTHWNNIRTPASELWAKNIENPLKLAKYYIKGFNNPNTLFLDTRGNHDNWMFEYLRQHPNGYQEQNIAHFMSELSEHNVLFFSNHHKARTVVDWNGYKLIHGVSESSNDRTIALATQDIARDGRVLSDSLSGHTHRYFTVNINGATHHNFGHLADYTKMPYLKHVPTKWGMSVGLITPKIVHNIPFKKEGNELVAYYNDTRYSVKADYSEWTFIK